MQLSAEALAKREARAARKRLQQQEQESSQQQQPQAEGDGDGDATLWENTYAFSSFSLKVQEEFGGESCVGGTQWPGGVRVARYLDNPAVFPPGSLEGKTVLDLGSGCGLVAAVAAKHGARVLATDKDIVIQVLTDNLRANGVLVEADEAAALRAKAAGGDGSRCYLPAGKVVAEELFWGPGVSHPLAPFDICIAAACLYQPKTIPLLLETLHALSSEGSLVILAAIIGQNTLEHFLEVCGEWFEYTAHRDEDGAVIGSSWEGNLSRLDVATRVLLLKRKERGHGAPQGSGGGNVAGVGNEGPSPPPPPPPSSSSSSS